MTLFAGFRCAYQQSPDENIFVVCADSQETVDMPDGSSYRVARQKIKPRKCGNFEIAMGGSAQTGELLDACVHHIEEGVTSFAGNTISELKAFISKELLDFGRKDAKLYSKKGRAVDCVVMARSLKGDIECWRTRASQLVPIERRVLIGWNENLYEHVLDRLYPDIGPLLPPQQAVLLGMHILKLAEDTSNYVRGPVTVIVGQRGSIKELTSDRVQQFQERIDFFRAQVDHLLLSLADHTIARRKYEAKLDEFKATILKLRDDYVQDAAPKTIEEIMGTDDPIPNLPAGSIIKLMASGAPILSEDTKEQDEWAEKLEFSKIMNGEGPVLLTVHCKCGENFEVEIPHWNHLITGPKFKCKCGEETAVAGVNVNDIRLKNDPVAAHIIVDQRDTYL